MFLKLRKFLILLIWHQDLTFAVKNYVKFVSFLPILDNEFIGWHIFERHQVKHVRNGAILKLSVLEERQLVNK